VESTLVTFSMLTPEEISAYLDSGEPFDKAGAYAIQGLAARFIPRIEGCYYNVMGLPLAHLLTHLRDFGWSEEKNNE
jgi:septum formation protein